MVVVDADGQHDPATIASMLDALDDGADMVIGSRFTSGSSFDVGRTRSRAMKSLHRVVRWQTGQSFTDTTSGFRAFDAPVVAMLARDYPVEYLADTVEVLLMVLARRVQGGRGAGGDAHPCGRAAERTASAARVQLPPADDRHPRLGITASDRPTGGEAGP